MAATTLAGSSPAFVATVTASHAAAHASIDHVDPFFGQLRTDLGCMGRIAARQIDHDGPSRSSLDDAVLAEAYLLHDGRVGQGEANLLRAARDILGRRCPLSPLFHQAVARLRPEVMRHQGESRPEHPP